MLPKVVSIQRLRPGSQTVVAAFQEERIAPEPFNVRIVLTDMPNGAHPADAAALVDVEHGEPSNLVVGTQFARFGAVTENAIPAADGRAAVDAGGPIPWQTVRPHPREGDYYFDTAYTPLQDTELMSTDPMDTVPMPTSENGMYYQYRVTITPHQRSENFEVKVRVDSFHDNVRRFAIRI